MIDTIRIALHGLERYSEIVEDLERDRKATEISEVEVPLKHMQDNLRFKVWRFDGGRKTKVALHGKMRLASSSYEVNYFVDWNRDCIFCEFSIPKWLYGMNVVQFVQHTTEFGKAFNALKQFKWEANVEQAHERLFKVLRAFFKRYWPNRKVNYNHVEIVRIDVCYNQYFKSKEDAFKYLDYMKRIRKKHMRAMTKNMDRWDTGMVYKNEEYYMKIYHKGTEYAKMDAPEHRRANKRAGRALFNTGAIQENADKILRFELTFRKPYMSRIFREYVFRRNCPVWKGMRTRYKRMKALWMRMERTTSAKAKGKLIPEDAYTYEKWMKEPKVDRDAYTQMSAMLSQSCDFFLEVSDEDAAYNKSMTTRFVRQANGKPRLEKRAKFSKLLLERLLWKLKDEVEHFQVREVMYLSEVDRRLVDYNERMAVVKSSGVSGDSFKEGPMKAFVLLLHRYTADEIWRLGIMSRSAVYEKKARLAKLGFSDNAVATVTIPTETGWGSYHSHVLNIPALKTYCDLFSGITGN